MTKPDILDRFIERTGFFSTFGGNNVSCAAGSAVLDVIDTNDLVDHANDLGAYFKSRLKVLTWTDTTSSEMCARQGLRSAWNWSSTARAARRLRLRPPA